MAPGALSATRTGGLAPGSSADNSTSEGPARLPKTRMPSVEHEPSPYGRIRNGIAVIQTTMLNAAEHSSRFLNAFCVESLTSSVALRKFLLAPGHRSICRSLPTWNSQKFNCDCRNSQNSHRACAVFTPFLTENASGSQRGSRRD